MPTGSTIFLVFTGVVTFAVILQTIVLLALLFAAKAAQREAMDQVERLREEMRPFLNTASQLSNTIEEITPRLRTITVNVQSLSERLREQADRIDTIVGEVTGKTRHQISRIDSMVTDTLDAVAYGTRVVQDNVMAPLRQVGGWMSAIRAGMDLLRPGDRRSRRGRTRSDEEPV